MKAVRLLGVGLFATAATAMMGPSAFAADKTMRVGSWLPPKHVMNATVLPTWGKWIEEATEGRVKLKIEYGGGHPKALIDQVQDGAVDAAWSYHGYFPGRFKLTQAVELPGLETKAEIASEAASVAHWRVNEKYFKDAGEHKGIVLAGLFTHAPGQIHLREPVEKLADMKGKKIRVGGGIQGEIGKRMGIEGVPAPGSKVYEILSQGVADGVFMPMGEKRSLRLKEVAPFTMKLPSGMYLGSFGVFLSPDFMDSLDEKDRKAIMEVSGEKLSALAGKHWGLDAVEGEKDAAESGNKIVEASEEVVAEFAEMTKGMDEAWLEDVKARNVDAEAALKELREIAANYQSEGAAEEKAEEASEDKTEEATKEEASEEKSEEKAKE